MTKEHMSATIDKKIKFDAVRIVEVSRYRNFSHFVEEAMRQLIVVEKLTNKKKEVCEHGICKR